MITFDNLFKEARLHGNGFLQVDILPQWRLHVFHNDLIPYGQKVRTTVHDHVFNMKSYILHGSLIHKHYSLTKYDDDAGSQHIYSVKYNGNRTMESTLEKEPGSAEFKLIGFYELNAGSSYQFGAGEWHESESEGLTITLISKGHPLTDKARVAVPKDKLPDNEYRRESVPPSIVEEYREIVKSKIDIIDVLNIITKSI